ncbi:unnamed protein product [Lactuca saligna]|uniref:Molybdate-anion transporter n=1 Tax=Lactuca saligna TaxID=75948 RepID=A0AA35ZDR0_LACSI|nr:unnamed protein product [Lactuca saligna]
MLHHLVHRLPSPFRGGAAIAPSRAPPSFVPQVIRLLVEDRHSSLDRHSIEAILADSDRLQSKLQSKISSRMSSQLSTPPFRWGPWLYYRRVEEGKQYPLLCRRLASLNEEFISHKSPTGYAYEEVAEVSPGHRFIAYIMYDKDNNFFKLCVRDLNLGSLCSKPQADWVCNVAWAKGGQGISSQAACFKKARDDLYKVKAWVFSPQVKVIKSDIREEDVLKEKDAFEDLKKLAAKSLTETVNQLIDTVNQVKEDENAEQATRPSRVTDAGQNRSGAPLKAADNVIISQHQHAAASQIQARETDIHALSLSKNETGVPMNVSESFKKEYAMVLLQLKEASDQVASALANLRRRNTYPEKRGILRTNNRLPLHCPSYYFGLYSKKKKTVKKDTSSDDSSDMRVKKRRGSTVREKLRRDCHLHSEGEGEAKRASITYCITYILNCITKHSPQYIILMVGRILRGIATSLLFSAFESWLVAEHNKRGFEQQWLSTTFSKAIFLGNGLVAILAGLFGNLLVGSLAMGPVAPFDAASIFLAIGMAIIISSWTENYGDSSESKDLMTQFRGAAVAIASDEKIPLLGAIQSLFEGSMYTFVFLWTPALSPNGILTLTYMRTFLLV